MSKEKKEIFKYILWLNLLIGLYNIHLWNQGGWLFNIIIGSLNIGVWVFNRNILFSKDREN